jgi:hypothetical protein
LVIKAIESPNFPVTFNREEVVAAIDQAAYEKTFKHGKQVVTIPQSIQFHLLALTKLKQLARVAPAVVTVGPSKGRDLGIGGRMGSENQGMIRPDTSDADIHDMARKWYGYGRWDAPFWFIGPEPGMDPSEDNNLRPRCNAWIKLGAGELVDCKEHHFGFGWYDWHREVPRPRIQKTWEKLIRLLLFVRNGEAPGAEDIRSYQQRFWGMKSGETCVIELCSLAANKLKVKKGVTWDANCFREERIETIRRRISVHKPALVVMYRKSAKLHWESIAGGPFSDAPDIRMIGGGPTQAVFADHPVSKDGVSASYWLRIAENLRRG